MNNRFLRRLAISVSMLVLCTVSTAGAARLSNAEYDYETNTVEISGKNLDDYNNQYVTVLVLKPDANSSDFTAEDVEKRDELTIVDGEYSLSFELNTPIDGEYTALIMVGTKAADASFTYASNIDDILAAIKDDITKIDDYMKEIGVETTAYAGLDDKSKVQQAVGKVISEISTVGELKEQIKKYSYLQALNEGNIDDVCENNEFLDAELMGLTELDESMGVTAYSLFENSMTAKGKAAVISAIQKQNYKDYDEFYEDFVYKCTLSAIRNNVANGTAHISEILSDNNGVNKFDLTNYNEVSGNSIDLSLLGSSGWNKDTIQELLDDEGDSGDDSKADSGYSGSGGGKVTAGSAGGYTQSYSATGSDSTQTGSVFTDLDSVPWAESAILSLADKGIVHGRGDGIFAPLDDVTRAEFVKMVLSTFGIDATGYTCTFPDVVSGEWYYEFVATGAELGIVSGRGDGTFAPNDKITRQDAAVIIEKAVAAAGKTLPEKREELNFNDKADISDYANESVNLLTKAEIINGYDDNTFRPLGNCTRAEAAVMLNNLLGAIEAEGVN